MSDILINTVLSINKDWPPDESLVIYENNLDTGLLKLKITESGNIAVSFNSKIFTTQKVICEETISDILISIVIKENGKIGDIYFDGLKLLDLNHGDVYITGETKNFKEDALSFENQDASVICKDWKNWRIENLIVPQKESQYRKTKSLEEQSEELKRSLKSLEDDIEKLQKADYSGLITISNTLRGLLFWPDNIKRISTYNPLLFRLAGYYELDLPVYAQIINSDDEESNKYFGSTIFGSTINEPDIIKKSDRETIMDFQEWLHSEVIHSNKGSIKWRWKDLIFELANQTSSHFDQGLHLNIDKLNKDIFLERKLIVSHVICVSEITIKLGEYILNSKS